MQKHDSDCAQHNAPAMPKGPCDCQAAAEAQGERTRLVLTEGDALADLEGTRRPDNHVE